MPIKIYFTSFCYFHCLFFIFCFMVHHLKFNSIRAAPLQRVSTVITRFAVIMQGTTRYKSPNCDIFRNRSHIFFIWNVLRFIFQSHSYNAETLMKQAKRATRARICTGAEWEGQIQYSSHAIIWHLSHAVWYRRLVSGHFNEYEYGSSVSGPIPVHPYFKRV